MGYEAQDMESRTYVLGLRDIETKSASHYLDTFKEILSDLDLRSGNNSNTISKSVVCNIRNTMSDRVATEMKFNDLLEQYHESAFFPKS